MIVQNDLEAFRGMKPSSFRFLKATTRFDICAYATWALALPVPASPSIRKRSTGLAVEEGMSYFTKDFL
jgi:hypothetical protein